MPKTQRQKTIVTGSSRVSVAKAPTVPMMAMATASRAAGKRSEMGSVMRASLYVKSIQLAPLIASKQTNRFGMNYSLC